MRSFEDIAKSAYKFAKGQIMDTNTINRAKAQTILGSNQAINTSEDSFRIANGMLSGLYATGYNMTKGGLNPLQAAKLAHMKEDGRWNYGAIAGSYIAAATAYRIASGGGVYRDKDGNVNMIGIPFI